MHRSYETQYTFWTYTVAAHCYAAAHYYVVCGFWSVPAHVARVCVLVCVLLCHQQGFRLILSYLGMTVVKSAGNSLSVSPSYTRTFSCLLCPAGMSGDTEVRENRDSLVFFCLLPPSLLPSFPPSVFSFLSSCQSSKQAVLSNDHNCRSSLQNGHCRNEQTRFAPSNRCDVNSQAMTIKKYKNKK